MRHQLLTSILLTLALTITPALAQTAERTPPATATAVSSGASGDADAEFDALRKDFALLYRSISKAGGILSGDKQTIDGLLERVSAFVERRPDHVGGVAMELQLAKWLGYDDRIDAAYQRLVDLRPTDSELALSWLSQKESAADADEEKIAAAYEQLAAKFPGNERVIVGWAKRLKGEARYAEALAALEKGAFDPATAPEAVSLLADCLFAEHRFQEAHDTLKSIPTEALLADAGETPNVALKREIDRRIPLFEDYVLLWPEEQVLRQSEEDADDLPRVEITTSKGRIVVELFENEAPNTVANFITLTETGFYDQAKFHRFVPDFMIQGGDPNSKPDGTGTPGQGNPGHLIPDEHTQVNHRKHFRDSLAMAKTTAPNTAGCQFYFNHRPTPWLNGKHTVFGRVIEGHDVARALRKDDEIISMVVLRKREHEYEASTLPVG